MKKLMLILLFILLLAQPVLGAFTTSIDNRKTYKNSYRWTGKPKDKLLDWAKEVEDRIDGTLAIGNYITLNPSAEPTSVETEGMIYYDDNGDVVKFFNGSNTWVTLASSSANTLDESYDSGTGITVDNGAVTFTALDSANNVAFAIVQQDAAGAVAQTITSAGTGALLSFASNSTGVDILGTGSTWTITNTGAATFVGITNTGDTTFAGSLYNVTWDADQDTFFWADDAILGFGNTGAVPDVTFTWNQTNLLIESNTENAGEIEIGATNAIDLVLHANTAANEVAFNANTSTAEFDGYDIQMKDTDIIAFGDDDDFTITSPSTGILTFAPLLADGTAVINMGSDGAGAGFKYFMEDAGDYILIDPAADEMYFEDSELVLNEGSVLLFRDAGDATDWTIKSVVAEQLEILPTETTHDQKMHFGDATYTFDIKIFGSSTGEGIFWDSSNTEWNFGFASGTGVDVIFWGDTASQRAWWDTSGDEWFFGDDAEGVDVTFNADLTGDYIIWDESIGTMVHVQGHSKYDDDSIIYFGTGTNITTADGDFSVNFTDGSPGKLVWTSIVDDQFIIGDGSTRTDFVIENATTATNNVWFDAAGDSNKGVWYFGVDNEGVDVFFYGATSGDFVQFDADADEWIVENIKINIMDDTLLTFGNGDDITMQFDADGDSDLQVTGPITFEGAFTAAGGMHASPEDRTTTANGTGTAIISSGTSYVTVTSTGIDNIIVLPTAVIGHVITIYVGATGFELQTVGAGGPTINTVDCSDNDTNEAAIPANSISTLTCYASDAWSLVNHTALGAHTSAIVPNTV